MKKPLMIALAAAGMTFGGAAIAQDQMRGGDMTRADVETRMATSFARMDANGDGVLNSADREARALQRFNAADTNNDSMLSFEEMQAARENRREMREERRAQHGERRGGRQGRHGGNRGQMMAQADTNGNGAISQAEFTAAALARFDAADANSDGTVTAEERRAQRGERRGRRGGRQ